MIGNGKGTESLMSRRRMKGKSDENKCWSNNRAIPCKWTQWGKDSTRRTALGTNEFFHLLQLHPFSKQQKNIQISFSVSGTLSILGPSLLHGGRRGKEKMS